jgi:thymidylate synthase
MVFEPLYYKDRMRIVNPAGDVGIATLWSQVDAVARVLESASVDLSPETSRIAVIANLYGNGLPQMLRNLLWNPQIRHILIAGKNLSGSREWLLNFFEHGIEEVEFLGATAFRIRGTNRNIDGAIKPADYAKPPRFTVLGDIGDAETKRAFGAFFASLPPPKPCALERVTPPAVPEPVVARFPSEPRSHTIIRDTPMEAWAELIFRLVRFGYRNKVAKHGSGGTRGTEERLELQNVKVVIEKPREESEELLRGYGFTPEDFNDYQRRMLDPAKPADLGYTYGNRLRGYFRHDGDTVDSLEIAARRLRDEPESRHAYIALWDNSRDLPEGTNCPCFVSAFFRRFENQLTLTATFRSHNAMEAWPKNVYGLMAIQRFVAESAGMGIGPITVISHSISVDLPALEKAKCIAESKTTDDVVDPATGKTEPRFDPHGSFAITVDKATWELVVEHSHNGMVIHQYRGKSAEEIERQLARDCALSVISHALYLGRELARKEMQMKSDRARAATEP